MREGNLCSAGMKDKHDDHHSEEFIETETELGKFGEDWGIQNQNHNHYHTKY